MPSPSYPTAEPGASSQRLQQLQRPLAQRSTRPLPFDDSVSGVGPAAHLAEHSIDVVADRHGVGQNLQDHLEL